MKEDTLSSLPGFDGMLAQDGATARCWDGHVGRVVQDVIAAAGGSAPSVWQAFNTVGQVGEPALGVMGGLIQSVSSPAERVPGFETGRSAMASTTSPYLIWFELESPRAVDGNLPSPVTRSETAAPYSLPPVSSFSPPSLAGTETRSTGSSESPAKTTPAPKSIPEQSTAPDGGKDVTPGDVSPRTDAVTAATDVEPTGRRG